MKNSHNTSAKRNLLKHWYNDNKRTLHLLRKIHHQTKSEKYTYPLLGGTLFLPLSFLSREEILQLGLKLKLSWTEIQYLLVYTGHKKLHLHNKDDYDFICSHVHKKQRTATLE